MTARTSMICPQCGKLISVSEERCPFCGAWRPGLYGMTPRLQGLFGRRLEPTTLIVTACVALYVLALALQPSAILRGGGGLFNFLSPGSRALYQLGMTGGVAWNAGWWWTVLTAIYLHGGILHIFFNVMWIRSLGPSVTEYFGPARAFVIFTVAGAVGFVISNLATGHPSIGASGSIFGLLAALIVLARRRHSHVSGQLWQWAILMFAMGFFMSGVNNWAHGGGFLGGWLAAQVLHPADERREGPGVQLLALACILATLLGFALSFVNVTRVLIGR